ncbi:MAG: TlpA family protein disulfide reductase [Candidatus Aenigmarchaeota archaeon]|nr:TlpA family protein disulfide reductase [Candidatus Aenigmarchaeota archaeon]
MLVNAKYVLLLVFVISASACVSPSQEQVSTQGQAQQTDWRNVSLKDIRNGSSFMLGDFRGKVVVMESMAVWCPLCAEQQREIQKAEQQLSNEDVVSVSIDIDPNEDEAKLLSYVQKSGFSWRFAVAPREFSQSLSKQYGALVLNPPSTPVIIIDKNSEPHPLRYGIKKSDELVNEIKKYM